MIFYRGGVQLFRMQVGLVCSYQYGIVDAGSKIQCFQIINENVLSVS